MNYSIIRYILAWVLKFQAAFLLLPCIVSIIYKESEGISFFITALICLAIGLMGTSKKPETQMFFAKEGFIIVALSWIIMGVTGALPFVINGDIPNFTDALFETISGFTTTGASILSDVEALSYSSLFWRSFTHWVGGMGVIVFILAIMPMTGGHNVHLLRAESPGPSVGKLVPRLRQTAKILYVIYFVMTLAEIIMLLIAGMPMFDSLTTAFGTAGTGGFGIKNSSIGDYSATIQWIVTIFMMLFGINFNAYYFLLGKNKSNFFKIDEVRWYIIIIAVSTAIIAFNILPMFDSVSDAVLKSAFQVGSVITTTGFSTANFDLWPELSKTLLLLLMFCGACAGSTGGGIKVSRIIILLKSVATEIQQFIHPRSVKVIQMDGQALPVGTRKGVGIFFLTYILIFVSSTVLLSIQNFGMVTSFTATLATLNNIGPGLELVGPTMNYGMFSAFSKYVLIFNMLAGRLELYPLLLLFAPSVWKK
ncbi:MAG: TrkH family potassium uptake protein [Clostridia bacterium]